MAFQYCWRLGERWLGNIAMAPPSSTFQGDKITIGEALEATAMTAGQKPVEWSDAAAIQAAEVRATGCINTVAGGVAAVAQSAATHNARTTREEDKTKLRDVLSVGSSSTTDFRARLWSN